MAIKVNGEFVLNKNIKKTLKVKKPMDKYKGRHYFIILPKEDRWGLIQGRILETLPSGKYRCTEKRCTVGMDNSFYETVRGKEEKLYFDNKRK